METELGRQPLAERHLVDRARIRRPPGDDPVTIHRGAEGGVDRDTDRLELGVVRDDEPEGPEGGDGGDARGLGQLVELLRSRLRRQFDVR